MMAVSEGHIQLLLRKGKPHSKYFTLWCSCGKSRRRKDGSCAHQRNLLEHHIKPEARYRVQLEPPTPKGEPMVGTETDLERRN